MRTTQAFKTKMFLLSKQISIITATALFGAIVSYSLNLYIDWIENTSVVNIDGRWLSVSAAIEPQKCKNIRRLIG